VSTILLCALAAGMSPAAANEAMPVRELAPGVFVIPGKQEDASPQNLGRVINTGFIVGDEGVIVIDSGANLYHGKAILATVAKLTTKPVKLLIDTHPNPNYVLGNMAFAQRGIPILSTDATANAMMERCTHCIANLTISIGKEAMQGTDIVQPQQRINSTRNLTIAGRQIRLLHFGHARTEGDLAVLDVASGVLFAGDLVYRGQIQHFAEANFRGWISALNQLEQEPIKVLVPGRGDIGDLSALVTMRSYLVQLQSRVGAAYRDGRSTDETLALVEVPEFFDWRGYTRNHPLNVQRAYFEIEAEDLAQTVGRN